MDELYKDIIKRLKKTLALATATLVIQSAVVIALLALLIK